MPTEVGQHNLEIQANAEHWRRKLLLQKIYRDFYVEITISIIRTCSPRALLPKL